MGKIGCKILLQTKAFWFCPNAKGDLTQLMVKWLRKVLVGG